MDENSAQDSEKRPSVSGIDIIKGYLKTAPSKPGVYRMLNEKDDVLYVGKAKNIKKRIASYTHPARLNTRLIKMVANTASMIFVTTHTEAEALLLEASLIKRFKPYYNILLKDDKSFPYILLRTDHEWTQITKHRGARKHKGKYYGPFANTSAVNRTLNTLQKVFQLRSCSDSVLAARTRPCLLHQIKRCTAPCVKAVSTEDYLSLVSDTIDFLEGRSTQIQKKFASSMQEASDAKEFEIAALYRDRLSALTQIQGHQSLVNVMVDNADVIAAAEVAGQVGIQVFFFRSGQNWGHRAYFPRHQLDIPIEQVLGAFLTQFYDNKPAPSSVLLNIPIDETKLLETALSERMGHKVSISVPLKGRKHTVMVEAARNAREALERRRAETANQNKILEDIATLFDLQTSPARIEIYDNSHIQGSHAVGGMVVAGPEGFMKNSYRKFNIKNEDTSPGDDFAMMREVIHRRFLRLQKENSNKDLEKETAQWPDLLLIDGGKGQLSSVMDTLTELGIDDITVVAISKGPDRNAGREQFHMPGRESFTLPINDAKLYYLQRLRDEAHRFAIGTHRTRRKKAISKSLLDDIAGIGAKRKKALLHHFGSAKAVSESGIKELEAVEGVSKAIARRIYDHFQASL